jgi:LPXTG-motif cell wall-anchored protein
MRQLAAIILGLMVPAAAFAQTGGTLAPCSSTSASGCHIVLDSHTNNPKYGNEAQFLRVANSATGVYHTSGVVHNGEVLSLRLYIDNDTNTKRVSPSSTSVTAAIKLDCSPSSSSSQTICATISSPNAMPQSLSSSLVLKGAQPFTLTPIENSATVHWAAASSSNNVVVTKSTDSLMGSGINLAEVEAGYAKSVYITQLVQVTMAATPSNGTGGTAATGTGTTGGSISGTPAPQTTTSPVATPPSATTATQPAVNVTQVQGEAQKQAQTGGSGQTTASSSTGSAQPTTSSSQSQTPSSGTAQTQSNNQPASPAAPGANAVNDATSDDAAIQSAQGQTQTQDQTQSTVAALPDTGATSATSGTLGLTALLLGFGAYYRSRQSLGRRLRLRTRTHA